MAATIPIKVKEKLDELSRSKDEPFEELLITALNRTYSILNPEDRAEIHLELCDKYLKEAKEFLQKGDSVQSSEKGWGAATEILKAMAAKEGKLRSHARLWDYVSALRRRYGDEGISTLWHKASSLHMNFYENLMPLDEVELAVNGVERFVKKLKGLMQTR